MFQAETNTDRGVVRVVKAKIDQSDAVTYFAYTTQVLHVL